MSFSTAIDAVIALSKANGNHVVEISTGWEKVRQVVHMALPMSQALHDAVAAEDGLRFWTSDATPHNRATCGFIDDLKKVAIEFPR
jgi:hypothetical protein